MLHPFDRYAPFTDVAVLKEASERPLRKSIRVNTLKWRVSDFLMWAKEKEWSLEQVPWCAEGFFIDRIDRKKALGKELRHLLGHFYIQEAASMLPVSLLDPKPGECILDMSAAPGSKTTQIAALMRERGVIVANDVQEKRIWTLKTALHRLGVINCVITKKSGQWFAKHMAERFDRVLIDAPCTAQGISRKDITALQYSSLQGIEKAAYLQYQLLESAIHTAKVGGRIVYSTCTLTPEENEGVVHHILNKYCDQVSVLDSGNILNLDFIKVAQNDSRKVQESLGFSSVVPLLRLWPQTFDTEGFFCAVLEKVAPTLPPHPFERVRPQEERLQKSIRKKRSDDFCEWYGAPFIHDTEELFECRDQLILSTREVADFSMPLIDFSLGLPYAKGVKGGRIRMTHELATLRGHEAHKHVVPLSDGLLADLLQGKDIPSMLDFSGDVIFLHGDMVVGRGTVVEGKILNRLPREMIALNT